MVNWILKIFGDIENINYIEYLFQIVQLIMTIITFLTVFMSVHYQENIVKLKRAKMEIKVDTDIVNVKKMLYEYVYMTNDTIKEYKKTVKIFDFFSIFILYISIICAFIYSIYLQLGSILLIWILEFTFLLAIYFISNKLYGNSKEIDIKEFFNYSKIDTLYNKNLDIKPKIRIILPKNEQKYIVEVILPYYFYNFKCILRMSDIESCIEILSKGESIREIEGKDLLNDYIIKNTFNGNFNYIDKEILIFTENNGDWQTYNAKLQIEDNKHCIILEIEAEKIEYYKQVSPITISALNGMANNIIKVNI